MALGSTQPVTEMSIPGIFLRGGKRRPARRADTILLPSVIRLSTQNVEASTS
jgi:hypothetical protein